MRVAIQVSLDLPEGATQSDARVYIREAVANWKGSKEPIHPMFKLDTAKVTVSPAMVIRQ